MTEKQGKGRYKAFSERYKQKLINLILFYTFKV